MLVSSPRIPVLSTTNRSRDKYGFIPISFHSETSVQVAKTGKPPATEAFKVRRKAEKAKIIPGFLAFFHIFMVHGLSFLFIRQVAQWYRSVKNSTATSD
ncbi:MAG: hypothetical protein LBI62_07755 [Candidatus Accumulibacter sp.]|jgi:hypothetical protein|nr:hypothetical protein [Accumulibacter sp.]